ncbi:MAG: hypothetical protein IPJ68_05885 [Candidatus Moraniibacteriota bacterium]|nr:MAG: hypothetical protein IPJ68_05885 [Candidatus Moranbacteria bacterium]
MKINDAAFYYPHKASETALTHSSEGFGADFVDPEEEVYQDSFKAYSIDDLKRLETESEAILRPIFEAYDPEDRYSDTLFYAAAYSLNRVCMPHEPPENTGSLDHQTVHVVEPLLDTLHSEFPLAVQRFRHLFCLETSFEDSPHKFDLHRHIDDKEAVVKHYQSVIETHPEEALHFALDAIVTRSYNELGIRIAKELIQQRGWEYVLREGLATLRSQHLPFNTLKEIVHKLSTPVNLPLERIEKLLDETGDDTEYIDLAAYIERRREVENLETVDIGFCRNLLRDHDAPFYDTDKARAAAAQLMHENSEAYWGLIEELHGRLREMWTNYEGEPDSPMILEKMEKWKSMSIDKLLHTVHPGFSFNLVMAYTPDDVLDVSPTTLAESEKGELIRSLMLDDPETRSRAIELISHTDEAYFRALFEVEFRAKGRFSAALQCTKDNLITPLLSRAHSEGKGGADEWRYVLNSSAVHLAHNTLGLYSPTGRLLDILRTDDSTEETFDKMLVADFLSMKHALSDHTNFSPSQNAAAVMLLFWHRLPENQQYYLQTMYETFDIDIMSFVKDCPNSFEQAVAFSEYIAPLLSHDPKFVSALSGYVDNGLKDMTQTLQYAESVDMNQFLVLMNSEYGETARTEEDVRDMVHNLSFDAVIHLQKHLGFTFDKISRREFFSLITYLKTKKLGEGFDQLGHFIKQTEGREHRANRIKAFLALEEFGSEMGEKILAIGSQLPEVADTIFQKYAELVESSDAVEAILDDLSGDTRDTTTALQVRQSLISKANNLLAESHQVLRNLVSQRESFDGLGVGDRSFDENSDGYWLNEYRKVEQEEIEKLKAGLDAIRADIELFKATFKTLKDNDEEITLEDFRDNAITSEAGRGLIPAEAKRMRSLYLESMTGYPTETQKKLAKDFDTHLADEGSRFTTLRHKGEIVGFLCFTETAPGQKYVSAVTLDPRFQKAYIGEAMIDEAFKREASDSILGADCVAQKSVSARYIEQGFIGVRTWDDQGDLILDIIRDDVRNEEYFKTKAMTQEEIVKLAPLGKIGTAIVETAKDPKEHSFAPCNSGFVLTRYFKDPTSKKWYMVYEMRPTNNNAAA